MSSLCCLVVAEDAQVRGEISGVGVIVAEDAATRKRVLGQHPRSVQIAQRDQVNGEAVGRAGGVVVVVAQNAPPPHQRVLVQAPGGLRIAKVVRVLGEAVSRSQGVGMIVAESAATPGQGVLIHTAGFVVALAAIVRAGRTAGHWSVESRFAPRSCDWVTPAASRRTSRSSVRSKGELGAQGWKAQGGRRARRGQCCCCAAGWVVWRGTARSSRIMAS